MKLHLKLLSLLLCLVMIFSSLVACGDEEIQESESSTFESFESSEKVENVSNPNGLVLFKNGEYTAKFVISSTPSEAEKNVYSTLRTAIKNKTKKDVPYTTDSQTANSRKPGTVEILVGNTNYAQSQAVAQKATYGDYSITISGNKIILYFTEAKAGNELVASLARVIRSNSENTFWIDSSFKTEKQSYPALGGLPKYPAASQTIVDCDDETAMVVASNTSMAEYKQYCETLAKSGYKLVSSRDVNSNLFNTYTKGSFALTTYFTSSTKMARIIAGPLKDVPAAKTATGNESVKPTLTLLSHGVNDDIGLGLIYVLPNGKLLIIDGGQVSATYLYNTLKSIAPNPNNIVIAGWYMSHSHVDHQKTLIEFLKQKYKGITIESILYNYPSQEQYKAITQDSDNGGGAYSFESAIKQYASNIKIIKPHTGQVYYYGSASVEILYTAEDMLPKALDYINSSSLVLKVKVGNSSLLALTDTTHASGDILRKMYGSYLKSDMVQIAHHGMYAGYPNLYETIQAKVLIWPSNAKCLKQQRNDSTVKAALKYASDLYIVNASQNTTLNLPHTIKNNKQSVLNSVGS